jgi:hypothetical protein
MWKWLRRLALAVVALALGAPVVMIGFAAYHGRASQSEVTYLSENATRVDLSLPDGAIRLAEDDYSRRLFLLGEAHGVAVGQQLDLAMLLHLNATIGTRYYVAEVDPAQAAWFNAYLDTGDETRLDRVFSYWARELYQWGNGDFRSKIIAIRELNLSLPPERRVRFIGMDRLQDAGLACAYLGELIAGVQSTQQWNGIERLRAALSEDRACEDSSRDGPLAVVGAELAEIMPATPPPEVDRGAWRELTNMISMLSDRRRLEFREQMIVAAFQRLGADELYDGEKFYGLWGMFHVLKAPVSGAEPMAFALQEQGPFQDQIVSIGIFNLDSEMMMPGGAIPFLEADASGYANMGYSVDSPVMSMLSGIGSVKAAMLGDATLFSLSTTGTPYGRGATRLARLCPSSDDLRQRSVFGSEALAHLV